MNEQNSKLRNGASKMMNSFARTSKKTKQPILLTKVPFAINSKPAESAAYSRMNAKTQRRTGLKWKSHTKWTDIIAAKWLEQPRRKKNEEINDNNWLNKCTGETEL